MSYCKFDKDSDVYMFNNGVNFCFHAKKGEDLSTAQMFSVPSIELAIYRFMDLKKQGYRFPFKAVDRLRIEHQHLLLEMRQGA